MITNSNPAVPRALGEIDVRADDKSYSNLSKLTTFADAPSGSGLDTSSTIVVCFIQAFSAPTAPARPQAITWCAWHHTCGLPVLTTNCSNNHGAYYCSEKLMPLIIVDALAGKSLPVYGDGVQIRDWLYVKDHWSAIRTVLAKGQLGETYNVGGWNEKSNIESVHTVCKLLDELCPKADGTSYATQITYVIDRPGHDRRYAIDARKLERELGRKPAETFKTGIRKTVEWYLANPEWVANVQSGAYKDWVNTQYAGSAV